MAVAAWVLLCWPALAVANSIPKVEVAPGVLMPVLSIGTGGLEKSDAASIVKNWLSLGARGIDTAWGYMDQDVVAKVVADAHVDRKSLFITSKIPGCADARGYVQADLKQLNTDYIDLLLIHYPHRGDCSAAWAELEELHASGALRAIGVSNFARADLEHLLASGVTVRPAVNQIQLNVLEHDDDTISFCREHNITLEAYSPLGREGHSGDIPGNSVIQAIASHHHVSTYQVALRWVVQHGHLATFQSTSRKHQQEDADVFGFTLSTEEMARLDSLQPQMLVI